jgi:hypothetical protein
MAKEDSEKRWKETLSSAAAKTALPLTSLLASGAYATQEALKGANQHIKNLEHTIKLKDVDISQLEGDVEGFKMACAELWTHTLAYAVRN